jgi:small ligand-binding sensory domain FIST
MPFASALSTASDTGRALDDVCTRGLEQLGGPAELALLFFSPQHTANAEIFARAGERLGARCLLGCNGEAIIGKGEEIENAPALSLWLGRWSRPVQLDPFHLILEETSEGYSLLGWPDNLDTADPTQSLVLLLADPYTFPIDAFLQQLNREHPGMRVVGGMASGSSGAGEGRLLMSNKVVSEGAVGVLLQGPMRVRSVVSQGCRPIGKHMVITRAQDNLIVELGGKPAFAQLQQLWQELPTKDQRLLQQGLHIGRVINEYQGEFHRGDFLVRNVMDIDRQSGALAITDRVRVGQTVQFQVRDADTADEDLHELLQMDRSAHEQRPGGALLFSCNGRGTRLFPQPHHDALVLRAEAGDIPLAGFFAQGELGPVGGQNFIHGFTASVVLFEE